MNNRDKSLPISFRLSPNVAAQLRQKGAEWGLSPGEFARKVVIESLQNDFETKVFDTLAQLQRTTQAARNDIETATLGFLVVIGNRSLEDAEAWVNANFRTES